LGLADGEAVMVTEMLLHAVDKSAIGTFRPSASGTFQMEMRIVSSAVTVLRALPGCINKFRSESFAGEQLQTPVNGGL
jgi:hypothetical protein